MKREARDQTDQSGLLRVTMIGAISLCLLVGGMMTSACIDRTTSQSEGPRYSVSRLAASEEDATRLLESPTVEIKQNIARDDALITELPIVVSGSKAQYGYRLQTDTEEELEQK
jgi:hypothetical protein